jgi:hypothetical protein
MTGSASKDVARRSSRLGQKRCDSHRKELSHEHSRFGQAHGRRRGVPHADRTAAGRCRRQIFRRQFLRHGRRFEGRPPLFDGLHRASGHRRRLPGRRPGARSGSVFRGRGRAHREAPAALQAAPEGSSSARQRAAARHDLLGDGRDSRRRRRGPGGLCPGHHRRDDAQGRHAFRGRSGDATRPAGRARRAFPQCQVGGHQHRLPPADGNYGWVDPSTYGGAGDA